MSRLSNSIVADRETFITAIFQQDPKCTLDAANAKLVNQPVFGLNKKMAVKRVSEIRARIVANNSGEVVCNGQMVPPDSFAVALNAVDTPVFDSTETITPANTNNTAEEPVQLDLLAAIA